MALVQVFGTYIRRAMLKYSVVGWGVPTVFPLIGVAWGGGDFADPKTLEIFRPWFYDNKEMLLISFVHHFHYIWNFVKICVIKQMNPTLRCFVRRKYGLATFYAPVVLGIIANWTMFVFIARAILLAYKKRVERRDDSDVKIRTVSVRFNVIESSAWCATLVGFRVNQSM